MKAIEENKKQLDNNNADDYKNELLISKEREIAKNIYIGRLDKIEDLTKKIILIIKNILLNVVIRRLILVLKKILLTFLMILKQIKKQQNK